VVRFLDRAILRYQKMTHKELINNLKQEFESALIEHQESAYRASYNVIIDQRSIEIYLDWIRNSEGK
jgi:hypothetical protein